MHDLAVEKARTVFRSGKTKSLKWRREQLEQLLSLLQHNMNSLQECMHKDLRKPKKSALGEIGGVLVDVQTALKELSNWTKPKELEVANFQKPGHAFLQPEPYGVVLVISPWNFPISLLLRPLVGAIAAGNAVILKPSEVSENTCNVLAELIPKYLDNEAIQVVQGGAEETALLLEQRFDYIMYTGGTEIGKIIMRAASKHLTPVTLELGGKSPCIVDKHTNLDKAVQKILYGKFLNSGQVCVAPDYLLCHEDVRAELEQKLVEGTKRMFKNNARKHMGKIINTRHTRRLQTVLQRVPQRDILVGGGVFVEECFIEPTIVSRQTVDSPLMKDELFGPILPILSIPSIDEAIRIVNGRPKPLALYVFSNDDAVVERVLGNTSSGGVMINGTILHTASPTIPFGGVGASGMGRYNGRWTFDTFSHAKPVLRQAKL